MENNRFKNILQLVQMAVLAAIIIVLGFFTPFGFLKVGPFSITFLMIPVVIGAVLIGPAAGAFLGLIFGLASFRQCFGLDPTGAYLLEINALYTFIVCLFPRIIMGLLVGLIFKALIKIRGTNILVPYMIASASGAILNTVLFLGALILFFWKDPTINEGLGTFKKWILLALSMNATIELVASFFIGTSITKALMASMGKLKPQPAT